jgi:signal transduction histidine kinase
MTGRAAPGAARDPDLAMVRRAGRRAAWLAAALVAVSFVLCAGLVLLIVATGQNSAARSQLAVAAAHADDVSDPPSGIALLLRQPGGRIELSSGAPSVLPYRPDLAAVLRPGAAAVQERTVDTDAGDFAIRTQRRAVPGGVAVVQAAASLRPLEDERNRLAWGLVAAGAVALVAAAALGAVTGRQTVRGLVAALRRQRQFVSDASHELRTPLTVLSTRAQVLRRRIDAADLDDDTRRLLAGDVERLLTDSARLADVVDDLLAASEPDAGDGDVVDLREAADDVVSSLTPLGAERRVALALTGLDGGPAPDSLEVRAEGPSVRRSLVALIDNALRHSPDGGTVTVACGTRGSRVVVTVTDEGPGIPEPLRDRLFDRFASGDRQADDAASAGPRRRYGLGLALVADTMHRCGGEVAVASGAAGSTFTLTFSRARPRF